MSKGQESLKVFTVMFQNAQLGKVMLAAGLQAAASTVAIVFVTTGVKASYWGEDLASIQARFAMIMSVVGVFGGSLYGRFSDSVDRRVAAGIYGLLTFLPAWTFLVMGLTGAALTVNSILQIVACFGAGSNVILVLSQDVARPEEREAAVGTFYMVQSLVNFVFLGIPIMLILIFQVVPFRPNICLWYQVALSAGFFICIASVKLPPSRQVGSESQSLEEAPMPEASGRKSDPADRALGGGWRDSCLAQAFRKPVHNLIAPLRLGCGDRNIRASCWAAALFAFSGDLVMDIGGQFFQESLGILPVYPRAVDQEAETIFAVLTMLPPQLAIIPGYAVAGWATERLGSRRLLKILIPISAVLTSMGALFQFWPSNFTLGITVVLLTYASLTKVPLFAFVQEVAPRDRAGEAMGAVGSCQQVSNFAGNLIVSLLSPMVVHALGRRGFWVYYPVCGLLTLTALLPVLLVKTASPSSSPEGQVGSCSCESTKASTHSEGSQVVSP